MSVAVIVTVNVPAGDAFVTRIEPVARSAESPPAKPGEAAVRLTTLPLAKGGADGLTPVPEPRPRFVVAG